jgi:hypothetical protein
MRSCQQCGAIFKPAGRGAAAAKVKTCSKRCASMRNRECSVADCTARHRGLGFCDKHYQRFKKYGDPRGVERPSECTVEGCDRPVCGHGLCSMHYQRQRAHGEVGPAEPFSQDEVGQRRRRQEWYQDADGYIYTSRRGRKVGQHRIVMEQLLGRQLRGFENVHHKNGNRADNSPGNLELWVKPQPSGQRPEDLAAWVCENYPEMVAAEMKARKREQRTGQLRLEIA